ncbi:MAG TPA: Hpt domain-containing protein [Thermodesulfobacteriota bacterium]|nr:Hpt domain-containing protein [Thermodesulfobacteriota bacterium]
MNLKTLAKKSALEEDEFLELASLFLKTSSSELNELQAAIEKGDAQKVAGLAHSVRGAAVTLGLTEIFEYAKKVEANARVNNLNGAMRLVRSIQEELDRIAEGLNQKVKFKN